MTKATDVLFSMLERAKKTYIPAKHVLFDSWFSFPTTMMCIHKIGFNVVGHLKGIKPIKYMYNEENAKTNICD